VIDNKKINDLPLNSRNRYPDGSPRASSRKGASSPRAVSGTYLPVNFTVNRSASLSSEILLTEAEHGGRSPTMLTSVDAIQEFKVQTSTFSAGSAEPAAA
jgi:hypothetical protein